MATAEDCDAAIARLGEWLSTVDPQLRRRHVPQRSVSCRVVDLRIAYAGRLDPDGVSGVSRCPPEAAAGSEVRASLTSADLVALSRGELDVAKAWVSGRLRVSAPLRDVLRLTALLGL